MDGWVDSPDVVIAKRLLDHTKLGDFVFRRAAPGEDGPLVGHQSGLLPVISRSEFHSRLPFFLSASSMLIPSRFAIAQR